MDFGLQVAEVASEQERILGLAGRASGDAEEAGKLALTFAAAALGDVGRHRRGRLAQLGGEPDAFEIRKLQRALDRFAKRCCPVVRPLAAGYHWSLMQVEYATDIVFRRQRDLAPL